MTRSLRIFLSSPGDVSAIREIAAQVIDRVQRDYAHLLTIERYLWEDHAFTASSSFQDAIPLPSTFDIVVLIVGSRLGTPLPERTATREYRGIDGRVPVTGTEWEFEEALASTKLTGLPDLLVYRGRRQSLAELLDSYDLADPAERKRILDEFDRLDEFFHRHFHDGQSFIAAFVQFSSRTEFATKFERHLRDCIEARKLDESERPLTVSRRLFLGLEDYGFDDAPVFFGQDEAIGRAMSQLTESAKRDQPFLLLLGASGAGKSSLAKAGVLPQLAEPRRVTGLGFLRYVVFKPSLAEAGGDLFHAFVRQLVDHDGHRRGLPELLGPGVGVDDLSRHLRQAGGEPTLHFRGALGLVTQQARRAGALLDFEEARLVLVVDQLEELYTSASISKDDRRRFIEVIAALARSGLVWVIATMRADFWHLAAETPELVQLSDAGGRMDLLAPAPAQLARMMRGPAQLGGLEFEVRGPAPKSAAPGPSDAHVGARLDDVIAEELDRQPGVLPLLSYLLDELYRRDIAAAGGHTLTFASYDALGHVRGAIATKAEAVLSACMQEERDALGSVLFELIHLDEGAGRADRVVARRVPLSTFKSGTAARSLVEKFLAPDVRLLVSDADHGAPSVRVAHEALITSWSLAQDYVQRNYEAFKVRRRIEEQLGLWRARETSGDAGEARSPASQRGLVGGLVERVRAWGGRKPGLLVAFDLSDAQRLLQGYREQLSDELVDFIELSSADDRRVKSRAVRVAVAVAVVMALLSAASLTLEEVAHQRLQEALAAQSRYLAKTAEDDARAGDSETALSVILAALPSRSTPRPVVPEALAVFKEVLVDDRQREVLVGHAGPVTHAGFSADGTRAVTTSSDCTARIWDLTTGLEVAEIPRVGDCINVAAFSPDGKRLLVGWRSGRITLLSAGDLTPVAAPATQAGAILSVAFSWDGRRFITTATNGSATIWDATGAKVQTLEAPHGVFSSANLSPDGTQAVTTSADPTPIVWTVAGGARAGGLTGHTDSVTYAAFSPDGVRIVTASHDETARLWDAKSMRLLQVLAGHVHWVNFAGFSPDGSRVVTASTDHLARVWDVATGGSIALLAGHTDAVASAVFSPDGNSILSAAYDATARLWSVPASRQVLLTGHASAVQAASFSPDGSTVVTASKDRTAGLWQASDGRRLATIGTHSNILNGAEFSHAGKLIALSADGGAVEIWTAQALVRQLPAHRDHVVESIFLPGDQQLLTASRDTTMALWRVADWSLIKRVSGPAAVTDAAVSRDGHFAATARLDGTVQIWDLGADAAPATAQPGAAAVYAVRFSPNGADIVVGLSDGRAAIWNVANNRAVAYLIGHAGPVMTVAWSPDGRTVATGGVDGQIRLWDSATDNQVGLLVGHASGVNSVAFSPDSRGLLSASDDRTARVWDIQALRTSPSAAALVDQLGPTLAVEWARAAQFEDAPAALQAALGLALQANSGAASGDPAQLAASAQRAAAGAHSAQKLDQKRGDLLMAFRLYAQASLAARALGWPDAKWRDWRYDRATLARVLAGDGMARDVAQAYQQLGG